MLVLDGVLRTRLFSNSEGFQRTNFRHPEQLAYADDLALLDSEKRKFFAQVSRCIHRTEG